MKQFIERLDDTDAAAVVAAMDEVEGKGLPAARHLDGDIYEVRANGNKAIYRVLFAPQGKHGQVLLTLEAFRKKTQKTPPQTIKLAKQRLRDWEHRGRDQRQKRPLSFF
ncbi:MAG TPA: type II toxin-antitoxin system RelE/ParE family toxin [Solirubrobacterales bacterium]|nr:type II toxin-antitoxin system RelE/ParE family toxin [Solirubrobacterales bacterium]